MSMYKYELMVDKVLNISLPGYYSLYSPSKSLKGNVNKDSLRELLLILGLIMEQGQKVDIQFDLVENQDLESTTDLILYEDINGREHKLEQFIKDMWGFYTGEMSLGDWINHIHFVLNDDNQSLIT